MAASTADPAQTGGASDAGDTVPVAGGSQPASYYMNEPGAPFGNNPAPGSQRGESMGNGEFVPNQSNDPNAPGSPSWFQGAVSRYVANNPSQFPLRSQQQIQGEAGQVLRNGVAGTNNYVQGLFGGQPVQGNTNLNPVNTNVPAWQQLFTPRTASLGLYNQYFKYNPIAQGALGSALAQTGEYGPDAKFALQQWLAHQEQVNPAANPRGTFGWGVSY